MTHTMVDSGIFTAVGNTPLIRLERLFPDAGFELFAKLEALNPGGSIKDRPALAIMRAAIEAGAVGPDTVVVESSSGNMAIGLAQVCRYLGLRFVCVIDPKTAPLNRRVLEVYGAEVECVEAPDPESGEFLQARIRRTRELLDELGDAFWPDQYTNRENPGAHYRTTMAEIVESMDGRVDYLFVATSTCGTVRGCGDYIRDHGLSTRLVAVDAVGSMIFSDRQSPRSIPGIGAGLKPAHCDPSLLHRAIHVDDMGSVAGCRRLLEREAILVGGSSGAVATAIESMADEIPAGSRCVAVLCDRGERYLETIFSDAWVREHCGEVVRADDDLDEAVAQ